VIAPYKGEFELWYGHHCGWRFYFLLIALTALELFRPKDSKAWRHFYHDIPKPSKELEPYLLELESFSTHLFCNRLLILKK